MPMYIVLLVQHQHSLSTVERERKRGYEERERERERDLCYTSKICDSLTTSSDSERVSAVVTETWC